MKYLFQFLSLTSSQNMKRTFLHKSWAFFECSYFGLSHNDTETAQQKLLVKLVENVITIICFWPNISIPWTLKQQTSKSDFAPDNFTRKKLRRLDSRNILQLNIIIMLRTMQMNVHQSSIRWWLTMKEANHHEIWMKTKKLLNWKREEKNQTIIKFLSFTQKHFFSS